MQTGTLIHLSCFLLFALLLSGQSRAQYNLAENGGFEYYAACPTDYNNLGDCMNVFNPCRISTSDYFNACTPPYTNISVPANSFGYQQPKVGDGYAGMHLTVMDEYREYIQVKLKAPLIADTVYRISMHVSRANLGRIVSRDLGAVFTPDSAYYDDYLWKFFEPQWQPDGDPYLTDTADWVYVSGDYKASGGEKWIILGSFTDYPLLEYIYPGSTGNEYMYLYIDELSVVEKHALDWINFPNVFTPDGDGKNDWFLPLGAPDVGGNITMRIFNRWGECIFDSGSVVPAQAMTLLTWDGRHRGKACTEGVYFYRLESVSKATGQPIFKTGFVQLLR